MVSKEVFELIKNCDIKVEDTDPLSEENKIKLIEDSFFFEEYIVKITCDIKLEVILREKYLYELEKIAMILNCTGLEFDNVVSGYNTEYKDKLNLMFKNS